MGSTDMIPTERPVVPFPNIAPTEPTAGYSPARRWRWWRSRHYDCDPPTQGIWSSGCNQCHRGSV